MPFEKIRWFSKAAGCPSATVLYVTQFQECRLFKQTWPTRAGDVPAILLLLKHQVLLRVEDLLMVQLGNTIKTVYYTAVHIWRMLNCIFLLAKLKISQVYSRLKLRSVWRAVIESQFSKWKVSPFLFWYFFITEPENLWAQVYGMWGLVFMYYRFILKPIWKITSLYRPSSWVAADFHLFIPYADTMFPFSFHGVVTIQLAALNLRISLDRITRYSK